jgi:hypothetical protein
MPNAILSNLIPTPKASGWSVVAVFVVLAVVVVVGYAMWPTSAAAKSICPTKLNRNSDGSLTLHPMGREFTDMNEFQQWFHSSGLDLECPLPILTGKREKDVLSGDGGWPNEQTYARTPINKVDDYEFSRIFGVEKGGHMIVPRQNFDVIIEDRQFDWTNKPLSSDERRGKYAGLTEGFTADGELRSIEVHGSDAGAVAAAVRDYDPAMAASQKEAYASWAAKDEDECPSAKERKEIQALAERAYGNDPSFEPVVTRVGANQWEVTELRPKRRHVESSDPVDNRVANTESDKVDIEFAYRQKQDISAALNPWQVGQLPWDDTEWVKPREPLERAYGPTVDHKNWDFLPGPPM